MGDQSAQIAAAGSLEAKIIRACPTHPTCPLTCEQRTVEDLGTIASFDTREESDPPIIQRLKEGVFRWLR